MSTDPMRIPVLPAHPVDPENRFNPGILSILNSPQ